MGELESDEVKREKNRTEKARGRVRCQAAKDRPNCRTREKGFDLEELPQPACLGAWWGAGGCGGGARALLRDGCSSQHVVDTPQMLALTECWGLGPCRGGFLLCGVVAWGNL